jgi:hypothetical protein
MSLHIRNASGPQAPPNNKESQKVQPNLQVLAEHVLQLLKEDARIERERKGNNHNR